MAVALTERARRDALALARDIVNAVRFDLAFPLAIDDPDVRLSIARMALTMVAMHDELEQRET